MRMKGTGHTAELVVCASVLKLVLLTSIPLNTFEQPVYRRCFIFLFVVLENIDVREKEK